MKKPWTILTLNEAIKKDLEACTDRLESNMCLSLNRSHLKKLADLKKATKNGLDQREITILKRWQINY